VSDDEVPAEDLVEMALEHACARLGERGLDPDNYPTLLSKVAHAAEQLTIARKTGRDTGEYITYLGALLDRVDADPVVDNVRGLMPPRRTLRRL
jgi:hypothetical protein